jgi:hypothetical protein
VQEGLQRLELLAGLALAAADHREHPGHHQQLLRAPAVPVEAILEVRVEGLRFRQRPLGGEHHLGGSRGKLLGGLGRSRLHHHRVALRRPRHVERPTHPEGPAAVVERVQALRVEE